MSKDIGFQSLFRDADKYAGISYEQSLKLSDTKEFDQLALESIGGQAVTAIDLWTKFKCNDHDHIRMKQTKMRLSAPLIEKSEVLKRIHYHNYPSKSGDDSRRKIEPWEKLLRFSDEWERNICWGLDSDDQELDSSSAEEDASEGIIRIATNPDMHTGAWVKGIIWDDEALHMYEDSNNYDENENDAVPLVFPSADSWMVLRPNKPTATSSKLSLQSAASQERNIPIVDLQQQQRDRDRERDKDQGREGMVPTNTDATQVAPQVSAEYMQRLQKQIKNEKEKARRLKSIKGAGFSGAVASAIFAAKRARDELLSRRRKFVLPTIDHAELAIRHRNTKADLRANELRLFHHPKLTKKVVSTVWLLTGRRPDTNSRNRAQSQRRIQQQSLSGHVQSASTVLAERENFSIADGDFICIEYVERQPHLIANLGMSIRILNFYRIALDNAIDDKTRDTDAENAIKRRCTSRLPRHLQYLLDDKRRNAGFDLEQDMDIPRLPEGQTIPLDPDEDSPFMGDVPRGTVQPSIYCNMFQAPLFPHAPRSSDFLLVKVAKAKGSNGVHFLVRELPRTGMFLCGQQEPQKIVPKPSRNMTKLQEDWVTLQIAKYFEKLGDKSVDLDIILEVFPHSNFKIKELKTQLSRIADEFDENIWRRKRAHDRPNMEYLESRLTPEDVCVQESCNAGEWKLKEAGIEIFSDPTKSVSLPQVEAWLEVTLRWRDFSRKRANKMSAMAHEMRNTQKGAALSQLAKLLTKDVQRLQRRLDIGRAIHERLLVTPWSATDAFVKGHVERGISGSGTGMLELTGPGDPSGIGEAYAYVRKSKQALARRVSHLQSRQGNATDDGEGNEDGESQALTGPQISHTNKDLRKLSKKDSRQMLVSMGMDLLDVMSLKRWDLIAMIREMAGKAEKAGTADELHRFSRDKSKQASLLDMIENYKETCQSIWERQCIALSGTTLPSAEDDGMDDKDDDMDDLEDLYNDIENAPQDETTTMATSTSTRDSTATTAMKSQRADEEEKKALKALQSERKTSGSGSGSGSSKTAGGKAKTDKNLSGKDTVASTTTQFLPVWDESKRVVKRITRRVTDEGKETTEIQFILSDAEVIRVERETKKAEIRRQRLRMGLGKGGGGAGSDEEHDGGGHKMSINFGKIKNMAEQHELSELGVDEKFTYRGTGQRGLGLGLSRGSGAKRAGQTLRSMRLPLMVLSARLESILMDVWRKKVAPPFHHHVDQRLYPDYRTVITRPICLNDIRMNIARGHYKTSRAFLNDMKLLEDNAVQYNGPDRELAKHAASLYKTAAGLVEVDKKEFAECESDIKAK
eukprot:gene5301-10601_t